MMTSPRKRTTKDSPFGLTAVRHARRCPVGSVGQVRAGRTGRGGLSDQRSGIRGIAARGILGRESKPVGLPYVSAGDHAAAFQSDRLYI